MKISAMVLVGESDDAYLPMCIASIDDIVDEIVFMVAPDIELGFKERSPKWTVLTQGKGDVDFSAWRNRCVKNASGDWILYIDADEILAHPDGSPVTRSELNMLINVADTQGINGFSPFTLHFLYNYRMLDGRNDGKHYSFCRFFRRKDLIGYEGKIHEIPQFENPKIVNFHQFFVWHFGHCKGLEDLRKKYRRSMEVPGNPFRENFKGMTVDQYCSVHPIFTMTTPIINYTGKLPKVMGLW